MNKIDPHFYNFLAEGNIICNLNARSSDEVIPELSARLARNNAEIDTEEVIEAVMARENVLPTVVGPGLAVPHARMENIGKLLVALGTSREGIDFNSPGTPPVHVVILILTPKDDPGLHLQVLSALAKDFGQPETVRQVAALETPADILKFFNSSEIEIPGYLRAKDVMNSSPVTLLEEDSLKKAIEIFAVKRVMDIPVIDDDGDLRGVLSLEDILKFSLPEHILWMENLAPILRFQPFSEMLRNENETRLADLMNTSTLTVEESIPAVQLAKIFLMDGARQIIVTRHEKLVGVVNLNGFITKLFWA